MTWTDPRIEVSPDAEALAASVAARLLSRLHAAQEAGREPQIALTGGSIAESIHREAARLSENSPVDWSRVVVWWGDERFVDPDDPDRNARAARADLLDVVGAAQVHPMPSSRDATDVAAAAVAYSEDLRVHGSAEFDLVMLGLGPDGHVASLFPGHRALSVQDAWAVGVTDSPKPPPERISLTVDALNRTRAVWFLVSGPQKAEAVAHALAETGEVTRTPARGVGGREETVWFLDRAAAALL